MKETEQRVKKLMKDMGMDVNNEQLVIDITIIYIQAQADQIRNKLCEK